VTLGPPLIFSFCSGLDHGGASPTLLSTLFLVPPGMNDDRPEDKQTLRVGRTEKRCGAFFDMGLKKY
jgi:hypothetical protein